MLTSMHHLVALPMGTLRQAAPMFGLLVPMSRWVQRRGTELHVHDHPAETCHTHRVAIPCR